MEGGDPAPLELIASHVLRGKVNEVEGFHWITRPGEIIETVR